MPYHIVIVGAGFGGVWSALAAKRLSNLVGKAAEIEISVIAPKPVLVIRPRLYEPNPATLVHPLTTLFEETGVNFMPGVVKTIDTARRTVEVLSASGDMSTIGYDRVILAAGSSITRPAGVTGIKDYAFDIDSLDGAVKLESHLERLPSFPANSGRDTIVVCGAGFTGIELAAELPRRLAHLPNARVVLVGNSDEVAPDFGPRPRSTIFQALIDLGVECKLGAGVKAIDADAVTLTSGERIATKTAVWTAGVKATPLTEQIAGTKDALGRLHVDPFLRVPSVDGVYATGDAARALAVGDDQYALMCCQHALWLGRASGHNAAAELLDQPLVEFTQPTHNCCLDLGPSGAVVAAGWASEDVRVDGDIAKRVKCHINQRVIYPPGDTDEALRWADPVGPHSDQAFAGWIRDAKRAAQEILIAN